MKIWIVLWDQNYCPVNDKWCQGGLLSGVYPTWSDAKKSISDDIDHRSSNGAKFKRMEAIELEYSTNPNWFIYEVDGNRYYSYVIVEYTLTFIPEATFP
jgi:hypothetical protein